MIRGNVWLDQEVTNEPSQEYLLPTLRISSDVSKFKVKNLHRKRLGVRGVTAEHNVYVRSQRRRRMEDA